MKQPCVYIMASERNGTIYTGVTANLSRRAYEHREGLLKGFTAAYECKRLVWYEPHERIDQAIAREKQIKGGSRKRKLALIEATNPAWKDLYESLAQSLSLRAIEDSQEKSGCSGLLRRYAPRNDG